MALRYATGQTSEHVTTTSVINWGFTYESTPHLQSDEDGGDTFLRNVKTTYKTIQRHNQEGHSRHYGTSVNRIKALATYRSVCMAATKQTIMPNGSSIPKEHRHSCKNLSHSYTWQELKCPTSVFGKRPRQMLIYIKRFGKHWSCYLQGECAEAGDFEPLYRTSTGWRVEFDNVYWWSEERAAAREKNKWMRKRGDEGSLGSHVNQERLPTSMWKAYEVILDDEFRRRAYGWKLQPQILNDKNKNCNAGQTERCSGPIGWPWHELNNSSRFRMGGCAVLSWQNEEC